MESIPCLSSSSPKPLGFHPLFTSRCSKKVGAISVQKRVSSTKILASRSEAPQDKNYMYNGRLVDESMIFLRKRIHEMKMVERNYEAPEDWMEWEKKYYTSYDAFICKFMGFLQSHLMETRPSVTLGVIAVLAFSLSTSMAVVLFQLMEITKGIMSGIHPMS